MAPQPNLTELAEGLQAGKRGALARAITLVESQHPRHRHLAAQLVSAILPYTGGSYRVGVSGPPGVGKSSLIEALGLHLVEQGHRLAVLAIDPSSQRSGGSILGDKTRMDALSRHPRAYIRPSAAGRTLGGVARSTRESLLLCEAAGFDWVLVETVGVGQSETLVHGLVDCFVLLAQPGAGDDLQGIKRGIVELAHHILVTKADGAQAQQAEAARRDLEEALHYLPPDETGWNAQVRLVSAHNGHGLAEACQALADYRTFLQQHGWLTRRRQEQWRLWFQQALPQQLLEAAAAQPAWREQYQRLQGAVERGELTPSLAASQLVEQLFPQQPGP